MVDPTGLGDIFSDIADDTSKSKRDRASRLLLKAIRSLPEREQDAVLAYLLDRALVPGHAPAGREYGRGVPPRQSMLTFPGARFEMGPSPSWPDQDAALIVRRLAAGSTVDDVAHALRLHPDLVDTVLRDLARRSRLSDRQREIFRQLADGKTAVQIAEELGVSGDEIVTELEPTEALTGTVCAVLAAHAALPGPPPGVLGASGPLRTMPVRFPEQHYQRLKAWCEEHKFPMAVVVRGVVERFLDEQQPAP